MSWDAGIDDGKGAFPFGRPIRWIVALLDGRVVPFAIHGLVNGEKGPVLVQSGKQTVGHRFLPRGEARIREGLQAAAAGPGADHELVTEWRDLVEFPTVLVGRVPAEFETLPAL